MHIRGLAGRLVFRMLRRFPRLAQILLPWIFSHMTFAIPLQKIRQTPTLLAFYHPQPSYPVHILIVPRRAIPSLSELSDIDAPLLLEVHQVAQNLVEELKLKQPGYRLIVNGGAYQDLPHLHWHLVSGKTL